MLKRNKLLIGGVLLATIVVGSCTIPTFANNLNSTTAQSIVKNQETFNLVEKLGAGWDAGNTLSCSGNSNTIAGYEGLWGLPALNENLFKSVKEAGFSSVRLPITWYNKLDADGNINPEWIRRVREVIDMCLKYDLYVVVDTFGDTNPKVANTFGGTWIVTADESTYESDSKIFKNLWTQIANGLKDYDERVIFSSMNEIRSERGEWDNPSTSELETVNKLNQDFVDAVRATGGNNSSRYLIYNSYAGKWWTNIMNNLKVPSDSKNRVIAAVHAYASDNNAVNNLCTILDDYSKKNGVPVIALEFGMPTTTNAFDRVSYVSNIVSSLNKIGVVPFWWDDGNKNNYGLFDRTTGECLYPDVVNNIVSNTVSTTPSAPEISSFMADKQSPQVSGTQVKLTAKATGTGTLQYKFLVKDNTTGNLAVLRDYSTSNTYTWVTKNTGNKTLYVDVKDGNGKVTRASMPYEVNEVGKALKISSFTANRTSPQAVKTAVTFTTKVDGGSGALQFKYYRYLNGNYATIKDWSTSNSIKIAPSTAGKYDVYVAVKDESGNIVRKNATFEFKDVQDSNSVTISNFRPSTASPQKLGNWINIYTTASSIYTKTYKYYVVDENGSETLLGEGVNKTSCRWQPAKAGKYTVKVIVTNSNGGSDSKHFSFEFK